MPRTDHSEAAISAYAKYTEANPIGMNIALIPSPADAWMIGFDAALAERRITDREALAREVAKHPGLEYAHLSNSWRCSGCHEVKPDSFPTPAGISGVDWWLNIHRADAILSLPSTPITSTREALSEILPTTYLNALMASGLVKDNGDDSAVPRFEAITDIWNRYAIDPVIAGRYTPQMIEAYEAGKRAPVDRLAVIREVIEWTRENSISRAWAHDMAELAYKHFGVAPVEEEA